MNSEGTDNTNGRLLIGLAGLVFLTSVIALVILESFGRSTTNLMALVGPVVAGLLVGGHVSNLTSQQNRSIQKIEAQTNGVLDARIRTQGKAAMLEALSDVGILAPQVGHVVEPATPGDAAVDEQLRDEDAAGRSTLPAGFVDAALVGKPREDAASWRPGGQDA